MFARRAFLIALSIIWVFALLTGMPAWCDEIIIGSGTGTTPYPFATTYQDARTQVIYLAGEIGSPYKFTALSLDVTTIPGQTMNNFTIRMRHTSLSAYPSPASWESTGWTTVYQSNETIATTGWRKFTLTTPFQYNGVDNLMVDFSFDNSSSSTAGRCGYTAPGDIRMIYYPCNSTCGDPLTWSGTTPIPTRANAIPNIKLEIGSVATPTFSPDGAIFDLVQNVTVSCATAGATIHYTTNGADPTESDPVIESGSTVLVDHGQTLKAMAWKAGLCPSSVGTASYVLKVATPTFSPDGGTYGSAQSVTVSCTTPGATIHYTMEGYPWENDLVVESGSAVFVRHTCFLSAGAWRAGFDQSNIKSASYTLPVPVPAVIYVKPDGNDSADGLNWATAKRTIRSALQCSCAGDEIWVAAGTYNECITLKSGVGLYGGFAGAETARSQRNWQANNAAIFYDRGGPVVTSPYGVAATAVIDGFTILGGMSTIYGSYGIYCYYSSPTIANNTIAGNAWSGIGCEYASPAISNNRIIGNSAYYGGGIFCSSSSPTVANNIIAGNSAVVGGAVYCEDDSSPIIANNTVTGNSAPYCGGIYCHHSSPTVSNNILAFNSSGVYNAYGAPVLRSNCVYNPDGYNYSGLSTGLGDFAADPKLVAAQHAKLHIQPDSPCKDAGDDSAVQPGWADADGQARIQGAHVDIGADESDGTAWSFTPAVVRVTTTGNDTNDGSAWDDAHAKRTVQAGVNAACAVAGEVWVAAGVYAERVALPEYTFLYGGFAGTESSRAGRNWTQNPTVLDGGGAGSVISSTAPGFQMGCVDGFTIRNGAAYFGGGVYCFYSSPTIANNGLSANSATYGGAIFCRNGAPTIVGNTISENVAEWGGGVYCWSAPSRILGNVITGNTASNFGGGGINCYMSDLTIIRGNTITGNCAPVGGGIQCYSSSTTISNNVIAGNRVVWYGGGISLQYSPSVVGNNTIVCNAAREGGGMAWESSSYPQVSNNVVAFNTSGFHGYGESHVLTNNCVYSPDGSNYSGTISPGTGDISKDPLFVNQNGGEYHLLAGSPCIDAGMNTGAPTTDFDGFIRPQDGDGNGTAICDMGAYEFPLSPSLARRNYADGIGLAFGCASVTAKFPSFGCVYVENLDRSSGVRVDTLETLSENALVNVQGTMQTDPSTGERYVQALSTWPKPTGGEKALRPLALPGKNSGGGQNGLQAGVWSWQKVQDVPDPQWLEAIGLNNIGLLVTIWGTVTYSGTDYFYVDDGSKLNDDSGYIGVKVSAPGLSIPSTGFVWVTGISSCEKKGEDLVRVLRPRKQADIIPL